MDDMSDIEDYTIYSIMHGRMIDCIQSLVDRVVDLTDDTEEWSVTHRQTMENAYSTLLDAGNTRCVFGRCQLSPLIDISETLEEVPWDRLETDMEKHWITSHSMAGVTASIAGESEHPLRVRLLDLAACCVAWITDLDRLEPDGE